MNEEKELKELYQQILTLQAKYLDLKAKIKDAKDKITFLVGSEGEIENKQSEK